MGYHQFMSAGTNSQQTVVRACPKCGRKNRLPALPPKHGNYACGSCRATITTPGTRLAGMVDAAAGWAKRAARTSARRPIPRKLLIADALWALLLLTVTLSNAIGPEVWWPGSANLYLPQIIWALPALIVIPWTWRRAPRWMLAVPGVFVLWVLGPLMGFVWHPGGNPVPPNSVKLRVMQCNVKWARRDPQGLADEVRRQNPDVIQFQDSGGNLDALGPIAHVVAGWNVETSGQYITVSRLPISAPQDIDISFPGNDNHHCTKIVLTVGSRQVALYNVHLLSPRWGLQSVRHHDVGGMNANADSRQYEAMRLASVLRQEHGPVLLTGDLNAPMQALVCREVMGMQFQDAFQESGTGYGYSYGRYATEHLTGRLHLPDAGLPFSRIDHILFTRQWTAINCWTGSRTISDHVPVYADLALRDGTR